jgi:hypothetical protein
MQVRFNCSGCFIEDGGRVVVRGWWEGGMFILNTNNDSTVIYARGQKVELDIDLWHKRFGHINFLQLQCHETIGCWAAEVQRVGPSPWNLENIIGFLSWMSAIRAAIAMTWSTLMYGDLCRRRAKEVIVPKFDWQLDDNLQEIQSNLSKCF